MVWEDLVLTRFLSQESIPRHVERALRDKVSLLREQNDPLLNTDLPPGRILAYPKQLSNRPTTPGGVRVLLLSP